ncbi:hypothetical protein ACFU0X_10290 [Streptomyces cellulosae]|uniref:Uncharacterized protein n=1 Tax=Streptomyces cellulosae TaxID=1968 RepID=A0ABW6JDJ7_STRCE
MRQSVWVRWSATRPVSAVWPAWEEPAGVGEERLAVVCPARPVVAQVAGAVTSRLAAAGEVFGCGLSLDVDGRVQEAACEVLAVRVAVCPRPGAGERSAVEARVELDGEVLYGPNSFALGRELAQRLGPAVWPLGGGQVAELRVERVEVDAPNAGRVPIYPARGSLI